MKVYFRKSARQIPVLSGIYFQDEELLSEKTKRSLRFIEYNLYNTTCDLKRLGRQVKQIPDKRFREGVYTSIKIALSHIRWAWEYLKKGKIQSAERQKLISQNFSKEARLRFVTELGAGFYATAKRAERRKLARSVVNSNNAKLARRKDVKKAQILEFIDGYEYQKGTSWGSKSAACKHFDIDLKTLNKIIRE